MKSKKFSIIEMIIVLSIITILMAIAFPYIRDAHAKQQKVTTRNMINQYKAMIAAYYTDYGLLPTPGHVNPNTYNDASASTEYWRRVPKEMFQVNQIAKLPTPPTKNYELYFDYYDFEEGSLKTTSDFNTKYPARSIPGFSLIPLEPWYVGAVSASNLQKEELSVITHSSKFLNFYMSGSGFDMVKDGSYNKPESKWLANFDTSFRLSSERSAMVKPYLYFGVNDTILWNGASPEVKITTIPPVTSYVLNKTLVYFDYVPKIKSGLTQIYSNNLREDKFRRLYYFNEDKTPLPILSDQYSIKKVTLGSDRVMFNGNFFGSTSLKDARTQKDAATTQVTNAATQTANANAQLAAAVTAAEKTAANNAVNAALTATNNANAANTAADAAMKNAKPGDLNNSNSTVYMRAHTDNVVNIVDAFNSPIVYITYVNQRKESAMTYNYVDAVSGIADSKKDKAMRADSFILYSLGVNKADDSNLGENYINQTKTGDDIIEMSGGK